MDTDYDRIAEQYKRARPQPWRTHIERYTLLRLSGDVAGKAVIDLACGEGYYTRELRQQGAARVVGVDLSRAMIGLAESEEARRPLGVEYRVGDVRTLEVPGEFDLAFAAYLLNYAHTAEELTQMCRAVARALRPGGRFVTVNSNPAEPTVAFPAARAYGFSRRVEGELVEGVPIVLEFFLRGDELLPQRGDDGRGVPRGGPARGALARARGLARGPARVRPGVLGGPPRPPGGGLHRVRQVGLLQA